MKNKNLIRPHALRPGDTVGIVAPARKVSRGEMAPAIDIISGWGYRVAEGEHLYGVCNQYSGTDEARAADFQRMLDDPSVKAVFCARGGYGSVRIIDRLNFSRFMSEPSWIVGYSDITVFHSHVNRHCGVQTLQAAMPINFPADRKMNSSLQSLKDILDGGSPEYHLQAHPFNRPGKAEGILCGGNLSMLYSLSGTSTDIDTDGKILFIEDLDEYLYHVDRMMMNLKRSGRLEGLAGLIVGGMNKMNDNEIPFGKPAYEIVAETVSSFRFPVIFGFRSGHTPENMALIMGAGVSMEAAESCTLKF